MAAVAVLIEEVSKLVSDITGVQLGQKQSAMVESRLTRRMIQLGFSTAEDYLRYINDHRETEVSALVSLLTTHHTNFFREYSHFEFLEKTGLPNLIAHMRRKGQKTLRIWSAACSRGHEVYSLAMFLNVHLKRLAPEMSYEIFGSDVDPQSVEIARNGVYRWDDIKSIPSLFLADNWMRGTGEIAEFVKAKPAVRTSCKFGVVNLLDFNSAMSGKMFDIVFCRNVYIYFKLDQIKAITQEILKHIVPEGYFFIGISESLNGTNLPVNYIAPSVYGHKGSEAPKTVAPAVAPQPSLAKVQPAVATPVLPAKQATPAFATAPIAAAPVRVFCIDDSPTILSLLKKILTAEMGFEVVGTAEHGADATEKLKHVKPDVITLDIHMPVQNGIEYLQKSFRPGHPPVVMVTSVSREDAGLGLKSLELGATDYVEKPSLQDLAKRAEEIRTKLRCAAMAGAATAKTRGVFEVERSFERGHVVTAPDTKLRVIFAGIGDRDKLVTTLKGFTGTQPPTVIVVQGAGNMIGALGSVLKAASGRAPDVWESSSQPLEACRVYVADAARFDELKAAHGRRRTSVLVFGGVTSDAVGKILSWNDAHIMAEEMNLVLSEQHRKLLLAAHRVVPHTSFSYHSDEFLSEEGRPR